MENLKHNLGNIKFQKDLFGGETPKLKMSERLGFLPISIWRPDWGVVKQLKLIVGDDGSARELVGKKMSLPGMTTGVSIFNPHLAQMILSAYCPLNANIYDPFGGGGTRGFVASAMGHKYTGIEIRQEEVDRIREQQKTLNTYFEIIAQDSRFYDIEPNSFDFSYTCPPYYDLEIYSKIQGDMSNAATYTDFLDMLKDSLSITYKGLKENTLSVWVVGNFRDKQGYLKHFNGDLVKLAEIIGFKLHDELIFHGASGAAHQRVGQFEANRKSVRVHEYILIFKKC